MAETTHQDKCTLKGRLL